MTDQSHRQISMEKVLHAISTLHRSLVGTYKRTEEGSTKETRKSEERGSSEKCEASEHLSMSNSPQKRSRGDDRIICRKRAKYASETMFVDAKKAGKLCHHDLQRAMDSCNTIQELLRLKVQVCKLMFEQVDVPKTMHLSPKSFLATKLLNSTQGNMTGSFITSLTITFSPSWLKYHERFEGFEKSLKYQPKRNDFSQIGCMLGFHGTYKLNPFALHGFEQAFSSDDVMAGRGFYVIPDFRQRGQHFAPYPRTKYIQRGRFAHNTTCESCNCIMTQFLLVWINPGYLPVNEVVEDPKYQPRQGNHSWLGNIGDLYPGLIIADQSQLLIIGVANCINVASKGCDVCNPFQIRPISRVLGYFGCDRSRSEFDRRTWFVCGDEEVPTRLEFESPLLCDVHFGQWFQLPNGRVLRRTTPVGEHIKCFCFDTGVTLEISETTAQRTPIKVFRASPYKTQNDMSLEIMDHVRNDDVEGIVLEFGRDGCVLVWDRQHPEKSKWVKSTVLRK